MSLGTDGNVVYDAFVYFDEEGIVKEFIVNTPPRKGSEYDIALIAEGYGSTLPLVKLGFPDGTTGAPTTTELKADVEIPLDPERPLRILKYYKKYEITRVNIASLTNEGLWSLTPTYGTRAYGAYNFYVSDNANAPDGSVSFADYLNLMKIINDIKAHLVDYTVDEEAGTLVFTKGGK